MFFVFISGSSWSHTPPEEHGVVVLPGVGAVGAAFALEEYYCESRKGELLQPAVHSL